MFKFKLHERMVRGILAAGIFLSFFALYFYFSQLVARTGAFSNHGIFFELDTPRVVRDMTVFDADHYRTIVHPLFVLLVNPAGMLLAGLLKSNLLASMLLNSFLGASGVVLVFVFFNLLTEDIYKAFFLACFLGMTTTHLFLSVIPETGTLSMLSLLTTYVVFLLAVKYKRENFFAWFLAGMFTFAITTTNLIQTLICFTASGLMQPDPKKKLWRVFIRSAGLLICVLACAAILSKVQKILYPSSSLFYVTESYMEDFLYTSMLIFRSPSTVIYQLLKHSFLVNIIAPYPDIFSIVGQDKPALTFSTSLKYTFVGWSAVGLWLTLLIAGIVRVFKKKLEIPLRVGFTFAVCLLFNFALHSIYGRGVSGGMEYFPYTGNFSFLVLSGLAYFSLPSSKTSRILLGILALLTGINNIMLLMKIIDIYR